MIPVLSLDQVAHVIALATAPAFLLGAVVNFLALLTDRMARVTDRMQVLHEIEDGDERRARLRSAMPRLRRRGRLLHASMLLSIGSGGVTALVVVIAFLGALTSIQVEAAVAVLFVASLLLFVASLWLLGHEALVALGELGQPPPASPHSPRRQTSL